MNQPVPCQECRHPITGYGHKCISCSDFLRKEIFFCQSCFGIINHKELDHSTVPIDYTQITNDQLIHSIIDSERFHLPSTENVPKIFPYDDQDSPVWKRNHFSEISYQLPSEMPFKNSIPFVCDYLRMNNSLKYLTDKLNLEFCSTDVIIMMVKYTAFDVRLFIFEQLCIFRRAIPVYFGVPSRENSSMKYYFLLHEMLHMFLPYTFNKIPFILSFGTQSCKGKTLLLNTILKTNFDCHQKSEFDFEVASSYYHHRLIQLLIGHQYTADKDTNNEIIRSYQCHVFDLHGAHDWKQMPSFFVDSMSVIIIHMDVSDINQIDSFAWPSVTYNQTATYFIFVHGEISDSDNKTKVQPQIIKHFGSNERNVHIIRANVILNEKDKPVQLGILSLLKHAVSPTKSLSVVSDQLIKKHRISLSTNINTVIRSNQLLNEFYEILETLSKDEPALDLFPLSRLKELSEKLILSSIEEQHKEQLTKQLDENRFAKSHSLLTKLAQLSINHDNIALFEKAVLLWNTILWQSKRHEVQGLPISTLQQLEMSKERFLREFQERSKGYTNLNGNHCWFDDSVQMKNALINIYQHSFHRQEYIEIINATSHTIYPKIFSETFSNPSKDLRNFFVVGIIGEQSGGKSFLINKVFGTRIAESKFKCTTGILATQLNVTGHETVKNIVILDTEGLLDQSKKNTDAQIFDRKIVLGVMARSHVVMINITRNINKTMQQILEIVFYGLNKLQITNKPKLIFLFRDQDPKTMGEDGQRNHIREVMEDIQKSCQKVNFDVHTIINEVDIHEFTSPFVDLVVGEREISFFSNNFCQKALSLRGKVIDHLCHSTSFNSFNEWLGLTLELWQQINHNSNLFDYESLIHLTLEKELETFCNRVLIEANSEMMDTLTIEGINRSDDTKILHEIEEKLNDKEEILAKHLLEQLNNEKKLLMQKQNLEYFPQVLFENTRSRLEYTLRLYKTDHYMAATRQFQKDEFQKKLSDIPLQLSIKIREIQNISGNTMQFETLFDRSSDALLKEFINMLENNYKNQSNVLKNQLIDDFVDQIRIDQVGVKYFRNNIKDEKMIDLICNKVLKENKQQEEEQSMTTLAQLTTSSHKHGHGILRTFALSIGDLLRSKNNNNLKKQLELENMTLFLKNEYTALKNHPYYDKNFLPIPEVANYCVKRIIKTIENHKITDQEMKNIWYTSYGIILNTFCDEHYNYINDKLITEFKQEISRRKEEVKQDIVNVSTAEEHGQALIQQIWNIIRSDVQKTYQNKFERFFTAWDEYRPSIISENCVNQLFRSTNYQKMFDYIRDPTAFIKTWLNSIFEEKYCSQLNQILLDLSSYLRKTKEKFHRMILLWYEVIRANPLDKTVAKLTKYLEKFLADGKYQRHNISLNEEHGGFAILKSTTIRINPIEIIPTSADKHCLLEAIRSMSQRILNENDHEFIESTKVLINNEQLQNRLFERFYSKAKGCGIPCPYCKQICDNDNPSHEEHRTDHHLLWVFSGYKDKDTQNPCLICCTSNEAFNSFTVRSLTEKSIYLPFTEHIERFNPTWKIINLFTSTEDFQLKAYIALEEDLAAYCHFKGRADMNIRKKFLRSIVNAHCYGLLVGIDYENTPNSLDGIPSHDVSCIKKQLIFSSIARQEHLSILTNDDATKQSILNKLNTLINNMDERSTFIFYFSGHGGRTKTPVSLSYLLTSDNQKLTANDLATVISRAKTNKIILMLDSCYSGGMSNPFHFDSNNYQQGIHILCSSRETQVSYQSTSGRNGFFTKYLIKGLKGKFSCKNAHCKECATRSDNLQKAAIGKVTSTELALYLQHAITGRQHFSYTVINGSDFDISFLN